MSHKTSPPRRQDGIAPPRKDGRCRLAWLIENGRTLAFGNTYRIGSPPREEFMEWTYWEELTSQALEGHDPLALIDEWMDAEGAEQP